MIRISFRAVTVLALLAAIGVAQSVILVPTVQPTIQAAINAAVSGDEIHVQSGIYTGAGNRDIDPQGKSIRILGLGGSAATVVDCQASIANPRRGFTITAGDANLIIEGLTIRNGWGVIGGGILIQDAAPRLIDVRIENCTAQSIGGGLAIERWGPSAPGTETISACSFVQNTAADFGGGVSVRGAFANVRFNGCTIDGNLSVGGIAWAGGINVNNAAVVDLEASVINGNTSNRGGGILIEQASSVTCSDVSVTNNIATGDFGGGIWLYSGFNPIPSGLVFEGGIVSQNSCTGAGGGIAAFGGCDLQLADTTIDANQAFDGGGLQAWWGAIAELTRVAISGNTATNNGGGMIVYAGAQLRVVDSTLSGNTATSGGGGGAYVIQSVPAQPTITFDRCRILGNAAPANQGGGLSVGFDAVAEVRDTLIAGNQAGDSAGVFAIGSNTSVSLVGCTLADNATPWGDREVLTIDAVVTIANSIIRGAPPTLVGIAGVGSLSMTFTNIEGGGPGAGNSTQDPMFVDRSNGDYRLTQGSPCRDAGSFALVPGVSVLDVSGAPRVLGGAVDLGAFEFAANAPGSGEDLGLVSYRNMTGGGSSPYRLVEAGDVLTIGIVSPLGSFVGTQPLLVGNVFAANAPPLGPFPLPYIHIEIPTLIVLVDGTAPAPLPFAMQVIGPFGFFISYAVPQGLAGLVLRLQGAAVTSNAANGFFAITDATEIFFL